MVKILINMVKISKNCQKLSKTVKIFKNCQKLSKMVKIVKNGQNWWSNGPGENSNQSD